MPLKTLENKKKKKMAKGGKKWHRKNLDVSGAGATHSEDGERDGDGELEGEGESPGTTMNGG